MTTKPVDCRCVTNEVACGEAAHGSLQAIVSLNREYDPNPDLPSRLLMVVDLSIFVPYL